jgi:hypothetical protein
MCTAGSVIGGSAHAESPECTPASSMCSITPPRYTSPVPSAERVDVDLDRVVEEPVDENGVLGRDVGGPPDVLAQDPVVVDDLHAAPAQHVGRPHQHRVADLVGDRLGLGVAGRGAVRGRVQPGLGEQLAEDAAVLGRVDRIRRRAHDRQPAFASAGPDPAASGRRACTMTPTTPGPPPATPERCSAR